MQVRKGLSERVSEQNIPVLGLYTGRIHDDMASNRKILNFYFKLAGSVFVSL